MIGRDGALPWRLPRDMGRFQRLTTGHAVVMGRRTWETLAEPLSGRRNIVLTRNPTYRAAGADVADELAAALALVGDGDEVFIAGGEAVYRLALEHADRIYLTVVHAVVEGDTRFPVFDIESWRLVDDLRFQSDERHSFSFSFRLYERRRRVH